MCHPLYPVACRLVGRPVVAYHINGRAYRGMLQSVHKHGIYMLPYGRPVHFDPQEGPDNRAAFALQTREDGNNPDLVYSPAAYFGFGALTGLTLGALAVGPYGYGGYWW